jgi:hypothetical protein
MEFTNPEALEEDRELLALMEAIAGQIAMVLGRR